MKKLILTTLIVCTLQCTQSAMSAGIGYVDYEKIAEQLPLAKEFKLDLDKKAKNIESYALEMERQLSKASPENLLQMKDKAISELERMREEYATSKKTKEKLLIAKIKDESERVRAEKGLDQVLKSDSVIAGGEDITDEVLKRIK